MLRVIVDAYRFSNICYIGRHLEQKMEKQFRYSNIARHYTQTKTEETV